MAPTDGPSRGIHVVITYVIQRWAQVNCSLENEIQKKKKKELRQQRHQNYRSAPTRNENTSSLRSDFIGLGANTARLSHRGPTHRVFQRDDDRANLTCQSGFIGAATSHHRRSYHWGNNFLMMDANKRLWLAAFPQLRYEPSAERTR